MNITTLVPGNSEFVPEMTYTVVYIDGSNMTRHSKSRKREPKRGGNIDDILDMSNVASHKTRHSKESKRSKITIYFDDNIMELKERVQLVTGIPMFRQHLFYMTDDKNVPLLYKVFVGNSAISTDIDDIWDNRKSIAGIPVNRARAEPGQIRAYETFSLVRDIAAITRDLYVVDIASFMTQAGELALLIEDDTTTNMIYDSFVQPFWPMMDRDNFKSYVQNNSVPAAISPDSESLEKRYNEFRKYRAEIEKHKAVPITIGIMQAEIQSNNHTRVEISNLFDHLELNEQCRYMRCRTHIDHTPVELHKHWKLTPRARDRISDNTLLITFLAYFGDYPVVNNLLINNNGVVTVRTGKMRDDMQIGYETLFEVIGAAANRLIDRINAVGSYVSAVPLSHISQDHSRIRHINLSVFYKTRIGDANYEVLTQVFNESIVAGIMSVRNTGIVPEFHLRRSVHDFDNIDNIAVLVRGIPSYYLRLTSTSVASRWSGLYDRSRLLRLHQRYGDIKLEMYGVREREQDTILWYLQHMLGLFESRRVPEKLTGEVKNRLRKLNQTDPAMYSTRGDGLENLSKRCQKQLQPIIYTDEEWRDLQKKESDHSLRYWNATTGEIAWYECPNPQYPYPRFLTDVHPQGYCVPCCKKSKYVPGGTKADVHEACLKDHVWSAEGDGDRSRHVGNFTRPLAPNRLAAISDTSIRYLYEDLYRNPGVECQSKSWYYALGVKQRLVDDGPHTGMLFSLAVVHKKSLEDTIDLLFDVKAARYREMAHGHLFSLEPTIGKLRESLHAGKNYDWNHIFYLLAAEVEPRPVLVDKDPDVHLKVPFMHNLDYMGGAVGIIIRTVHSGTPQYSPLVFCNTDQFFNTNVVLRTSYHKTSVPYYNIKCILRASVARRRLTVASVCDVLDSPTLYVSPNNRVYGAHKGKYYVPIEQSWVSSGTKAVFDWTKPVDADASLKLMDVTGQQIAKYKGKVVGVIARGMMWYGRSVQKLEVVELMYDPRDVNNSLAKPGSPHNNNMIQAVWRHYTYERMKIEMINYIASHTNTKKRREIIKNLRNLEVLSNLVGRPDYLKIVSIINMHQHYEGEDPESVIERTKFEFDRPAAMSVSDVQKLLSRLCVEVSKVDGMLQVHRACNGGVGCQGKRAMVPRGSIAKFAPILASEMSVIGLESPLLNKPVISMKFKKRPNERIEVVL